MEALVTGVLSPYSLQNVTDAINTDFTLLLFYCLQTDASNKKIKTVSISDTIFYSPKWHRKQITRFL